MNHLGVYNEEPTTTMEITLRLYFQELYKNYTFHFKKFHILNLIWNLQPQVLVTAE